MVAKIFQKVFKQSPWNFHHRLVVYRCIQWHRDFWSLDVELGKKVIFFPNIFPHFGRCHKTVHHERTVCNINKILCHCMYIDMIIQPWKFQINLMIGFWKIFATVLSNFGSQPSWFGNHGYLMFQNFVFLLFLIQVNILRKKWIF